MGVPPTKCGMRIMPEFLLEGTIFRKVEYPQQNIECEGNPTLLVRLTIIKEAVDQPVKFRMWKQTKIASERYNNKKGRVSLTNIECEQKLTDKTLLIKRSRRVTDQSIQKQSIPDNVYRRFGNISN